MKTIEILFGPDGRSRVETKGYTGTDCRDASRFLEQSLGEQTTEILKPEFHQSASIQQPTTLGR